MTDTGAYSDVVFGLFRLLGYRFSPRLADIGGTRFDPALMTARLANAVKDPLSGYECENDYGIEEGPEGDDYGAALGSDAGTLRQIEQQRNFAQNQRGDRGSGERREIDRIFRT